MVYEPFRPDLERGKWEKPTDFILATFGLAFKLDIFSMYYWLYFEFDFFAMLPYFLYLVIYLVPILVVHSFMGQFSSSGFISAFRLAPVFKGMGYYSLFLSASVLIYYSVFAAVPLFYLIGALRPTLPWSCEDIGNWVNVSEYPMTICNISIEEMEEIAATKNGSKNIEITLLHIPSVMYFREQYTSYDIIFSYTDEYEISWHFVTLFIVIWSIIAFVFYNFSDTAKFGKFIRYMVITTVILLLICFVRFLFLPGALNGIINYFKPRCDAIPKGAITTPIMVIQSLGAGWGSVISLSSFNEFKTNIMHYSWIIAFGHIFIYILFGMVTYMLGHFYLGKRVQQINLSDENNK